MPEESPKTEEAVEESAQDAADDAVVSEESKPDEPRESTEPLTLDSIKKQGKAEALFLLGRIKKALPNPMIVAVETYGSRLAAAGRAVADGLEGKKDETPKGKK